MESAFLRMWDVPSSVIFCRSCILMLPTICCTYFPNPFLISTMTPITPGIVIAFIPQILSTLISRSLYFESLSVTFTEVFFSVEMDISMNTQLVSCLFLITMSGLWPLSQYLFVLAFATRLWCCLVTVSGSCSDHFSFMSIFISLQMFQWRYDHGSFVGVCMYSVLASSWSQCTLPQYGE